MKILFHPPYRRDSTPSLALLVAITMLGTMGLHMFIPALPATARDLHASAGVVQLTLTLYMVGLGVGQAIYGPLSDRFGRRPLLIGGLLLYVLSSLAAALAGSAGQLIAARVFQSLGACSGLVLGRAMARDGISSDQAAARMAIIMTAMTMTPALAPVIGGYISAWVGWRATFLVLAGGGMLVLILATLILPETNRHPVPLPGIGPMLRSYGRLLGLRSFRGYVLGGCCTSTSLYAFFAASPFIFVEVLHEPQQHVGLYYLMPVCGVSLGSFVSSRVVGRISPRVLTRYGNSIQLAGALVLLGVELFGQVGVFSLLAPIVFLAAGSGLAASNAAALAISADPDLVGTASGLYGLMQMAFGALCTLGVSLAPGKDPTFALAIVLLAAAVLGQWAFAHAAGGARPARQAA